jgi:rhodanese-related sulfurtransferase
MTRPTHLSLQLVLLLLLALCTVSTSVAADAPRDPQIPTKQLIIPEELNTLLKSQKPLLLHVGFSAMYQQAHIPGSEYVGATSSPESLDALRTRVKALPKDSLIVIYCGCCPWEQCPNTRPAYKQLRNLGYTNVRVLYIANNFGADWVDKGYPTAKGE